MASKTERKGPAEARAFDRDALAAVYDTYHPLLYRYISRQVSDMETARDLTAEVFKRFLQALQTGRGPEKSLQAWLYRAAHNVVVDHYRRRQHRDHLPLPDQLVDGGADTAAAAESHMATAHVQEALLALTADQRQVITLKFLAGLSNSEIAAIMEKPVGAVKALQHRGLAALQRRLIPEEEVAL